MQYAGPKLAKFSNFLNSFDPSKGPDSENNPRFSKDEISELYEQGLSMGLSEEAASNAVIKYYDEIKNRGNLLISPKTENYAEQMRSTLPDASDNKEKIGANEEKIGDNPLPEPTPTAAVDPSTSLKPVTGPYEGTYSTGYLNPYTGVNTANPSSIQSSGEQNSIKTKVDNSINTKTVDKSNNTRYYGGSNKVFNYSGGSGLSRLYDTPVSAATMAGFYDVDDSPAASASFLDRYIDMNLLNQKNVEKDHKATGNFDYSKSKAAGYDPAQLLDSVKQTGINAYNNAQSILDKTFGTGPNPAFVDDADYVPFSPEPIKLEEEDED